MKKIIFTLILFSIAKLVLCQDVILKKTGDEINGKVSEVTSTEIKYKKTENPNVTYSILKSEVFMITYGNGTKDVFNDNSVTTTNTTTSVNTSTPTNNVTTSTASKQSITQINKIDVAESTLKVGGFGEESFYYAFVEGDQLIFNFEELNGKELKEVEIIEYPSSSKYMDYKTSKITDKTINITKTGIYKFRLSNSAMSGRVCNYIIQRIPLNESTKDFNTSVYWKTIYDTTYVNKSKQVVDKIDSSFEKSNTTITVDASQKNYWTYAIPSNTKFWSYYIGVGQEAQEALKTDMKTVSKLMESKVVSTACKAFGGTGLEGYALGYLTKLTIPTSGEDVDYGIITDYANLQLYYSNPSIAKGLKWVSGVVADYSKISSQTEGTVYFALHNDNYFQNIDVTINCAALVVNTIYKTVYYKEMQVTSTQEPYFINNINNSNPVNLTTSTGTAINNSNSIPNDSILSNVAVPKTSTNTTNETKNTVTTNSSIEYKFFIIAGSYNTEQLANDAVITLISNGFPNAVVVGKNDYGSFRVAYKGYTTKDEALNDLPSIKTSTNSSAWIFEKK